MGVQLPNPATTVLRELITAIHQLATGRGNAGGTVTLAASTTTTTVTHQAVSKNACISCMPTTANAAAEIGNGTLYVGTVSSGSFVITHANNAQTDRIFKWSATNG